MATLGFATEIKGEKTNFVPKILHSLIKNGFVENDHTIQMLIQAMEIKSEKVDKGIEWDLNKIVKEIPLTSEIFNLHPKHHTIRVDASDFWKEGMKIHMVIFNRSEYRFQFVPVIKCKGTQAVKIIYNDYPHIEVAGVKYFPWNTPDYVFIQRLAINDGFKSVEDFFKWFDEDFTGKIIHWTDIRY